MRTDSLVPSRGIQRHVVTPDRQRLGCRCLPDTIAEGVRRLGWLALVYAIANITGPFRQACAGGRRGEG